MTHFNNQEDQIISRSPESEGKALVTEVYSVIEEGGVALVKFDVGYAMVGCTSDAICRIFTLKNRPSERKGVVLGNPHVVKALTNISENIIEGFSYPVGLVARINYDSNYARKIPDIAKKADNIAIFINMGELGDSLSSYAFERRKLVFGSSGNISNSGYNYAFKNVDDKIKAGVDFVLDFGDSKYSELRSDGRGLSATMIDLENKFLLRRGLLCEKIMQQAREMGLEISEQ